jgi:hypothetical protein
VVAADVTCWHCGQPLPQGRDGTGARGSADTDGERPSALTVAIYGGLTAAAILAALLAMSILGRWGS